jgi:molecular chaperone HscB
MSPLESLRTSTDHFAALGLPRRYALEPASLEQRYLELARLTHPDLAGPEPEAQLEAMDLSARLNEAHKVLSDDEARADYLLVLLGGPRRDEDKTLPDGFLPIIMITREELAEAQLDGDAERVASIELDARAQRTARLQEIARLLDTTTAATPPDPTTLKQARTELNALRYYQRLLEQVNPDTGPTL